MIEEIILEKVGFSFKLTFSEVTVSKYDLKFPVENDAWSIEFLDKI